MKGGELYMTEGEKQEAVRQFVGIEIYACQSLLIEELLQKEIFSFDEVENLYVPFNGTKNSFALACATCAIVVDELDSETRQCEDCFRDTQEAQEIFEWWVVSDFLAEKLRAKAEPILENNFGTWWGRCTTGQAICIDYVINKIYDETMY